MKKAFLIIALIGVCFLVAGGAIFTAELAQNDWIFILFSNSNYIEQTFSVDADAVKGISVETDTLKIKYVQANDDKITVDYYVVGSSQGRVVSYFLPELSEEGVLIFKEESKFVLFSDYSSIGITVRVPAGKELPVDLETHTGKIIVGEEGKETLASSLNVRATTGRVELMGNIVCSGEVSVKTTTGRVQCAGKIVAEKVTMETSTGKIIINAPVCAKAVDMETTTGDIECNAPLEADAIAVECSTGDIELTIKGEQSDYTYSYRSTTGKSHPSSFTGGEKTITAKTSTGDISLTFVE